MQSKRPVLDARYFQILFQLIFLGYGLLFLNWQANWNSYLLYISSALGFQCLFDCVRMKSGIRSSHLFRGCLSAMISALSLCLLLKVNNLSTCVVASFFSISSKFIFRDGNNHFFNPSAFGIVATILLTGDAWLSPGQWGSNVVLVFGICSLGFIVVTRVQKLDISLAFLFTYAGLLFLRQVVYLDWDADFYIQSISTGSLLLFSFFMISDPKTSPQHPMARIIWATVIAGIAFYLSAFKFINNAAIWVLVPSGLIVPLMNVLFKAKAFSWEKSRINPEKFSYEPIQIKNLQTKR